MALNQTKEKLVALLQEAYSGELAAAFAYRAHWKTLKIVEQRKQVQKIEQEEWKHRAGILKMLTFLGAKPLKRKEVKAWLIGRILGSLCFLFGWFLPMCFAGWLEAKNVHQYKVAASYAHLLKLEDFKQELLQMQQVEQEHEDFFLGLIKTHPWLPWIKKLLKWA